MIHLRPEAGEEAAERGVERGPHVQSQRAEGRLDLVTLYEEDERPVAALREIVHVGARPGTGERDVEVGPAAVRLHSGDAGEREDVRVVPASGDGARQRGDLHDVLGVVAVAADRDAAVDVHAVIVRAGAGGWRRVAGEEAGAASVQREGVAFGVDGAGVLGQRRIELHQIGRDAEHAAADLAIDAQHQTARIEIESEISVAADPLARSEVAAEECGPAAVVLLLAACVGRRLRRLEERLGQRADGDRAPVHVERQMLDGEALRAVS